MYKIALESQRSQSCLGKHFLRSLKNLLPNSCSCTHCSSSSTLASSVASATLFTDRLSMFNGTRSTTQINCLKKKYESTAAAAAADGLKIGGRVESDVHQAMKDYSPPQKFELLPQSKYGGEHTVTLLTGNSAIGKQGAKYVRTLFEIAKVPIYFERIVVGHSGHTEQNTNDYLLSVMRNRVAIHIDSQHDPAQKHLSGRINNDLDLFASVIKLHCFEGYNCRFPELDLMLVLQNNTGDYSKLEYEPVDGVVETLCIAERQNMRRYLNFVFDYVSRHCRKKITIPHKMSALPRTDGMFLRIAKEIQQEKYPHIELERMSVGKMSLALVECPQMFDVICASDRYGTFLTSIASAVCGGASLFSAVEMNNTHAVFKPLQTKLSITNTTVLSPYGIVKACVDLLSHIGNTECAHLMWKELLSTMMERGVKTSEFGGCSREEFVICDIVNNLKCKFA